MAFNVTGSFYLMITDAILIQQPAIDFATFLGLAHKMLDYHLSEKADSSRRDLHDGEKFLTCLAAMEDRNAHVNVTPDSHLVHHVSFSVLIAIDERDMTKVLELCATMPFVVSETMVRGVQMGVITGTLGQWRDAVVAGCRPNVEHSIRTLFNKILTLFEAVNLNMWGHYNRKSVGNTFLLEDNR